MRIHLAPTRGTLPLLLLSAAALLSTACSTSSSRSVEAPSAPTSAPAPVQGGERGELVAKCEGGDPQSCYVLLKAYVDGEMSEAEHKALHERFKRGCTEDPKRCFAMAWYISDLEKATLLHEHACDAGVPAACYMAGLYTLQGINAPDLDTDRKVSMFVAAFETFERACRSDFFDGCIYQAKMQYDGFGELRDLEASKDTLQKACKAGSVRSCEIIPAIECEQGQRTEGCSEIGPPNFRTRSEHDEPQRQDR